MYTRKASTYNNVEGVHCLGRVHNCVSVKFMCCNVVLCVMCTYLLCELCKVALVRCEVFHSKTSIASHSRSCTLREILVLYVVKFVSVCICISDIAVSNNMLVTVETNNNNMRTKYTFLNASRSLVYVWL